MISRDVAAAAEAVAQRSYGKLLAFVCARTRDEIDAAGPDARLADYQPYWAARAGLLARCGDACAADAAYARAIGLEADPAVRRFLQARRESAASH